jgi:hypothetical protein
VVEQVTAGGVVGPEPFDCIAPDGVQPVSIGVQDEVVEPTVRGGAVDVHVHPGVRGALGIRRLTVDPGGDASPGAIAGRLPQVPSADAGWPDGSQMPGGRLDVHGAVRGEDRPARLGGHHVGKRVVTRDRVERGGVDHAEAVTEDEQALAVRGGLQRPPAGDDLHERRAPTQRGQQRGVRVG